MIVDCEERNSIHDAELKAESSSSGNCDRMAGEPNLLQPCSCTPAQLLDV